MQANSHTTTLRMMLDVSARQVDLGQKIGRARRVKGWKQKHLAAAVHVEPVTVSRWERGATTPTIDMLETIADALDVSLEHLVGSASPASVGESQLRKLVNAVGRIEARLERLEAALVTEPPPGPAVSPKKRRASKAR